VAIAEQARLMERRPEVRDRMLTLPDRFRPEAADGFAAEFALKVDDQRFRIAVAQGRCTVRDEDPAFPSARIATDASTWLALDEGRMTSIDAFLDERIAVRGNVEHAVRMQSLFRPNGRQRSPQDLEHVTIRAGGHALSCYAFGEGPPVILLHGLGGTKLSYLPLLGPLAQRHRVIAPDLPGHGESTKPRADYTPAYFAWVILGLLEALHAERVTLVGNSLGGRIALEVASEAPARVASLVLMDPAVAGIPWPFYARLLRIVPAGAGAVPFPLRRRMVILGIRQLFGDPGRLPPPAYLAGADEFVRIYRSRRARVALLSAIRGLAQDPVRPFWERIETVSAPTLIVWGQEDRLVPVLLGRRLASAMRHAELSVLPGVGHVPQFEVPDLTRDLVRGFLDRLPA
jgi:pimeloyl-ACP methyl ester carboxylesterase/putative sterol carrier protein